MGKTGKEIDEEGITGIAEIRTAEIRIKKLIHKVDDRTFHWVTSAYKYLLDGKIVGRIWKIKGAGWSISLEDGGVIPDGYKTKKEAVDKLTKIISVLHEE